MTFEVWDKSTPDVTYEVTHVSFPAYEFYKSQAELVASVIKGTELTEDNIKDVKKDLAAARKIVDGLKKRRTALKKEILSGMDDFNQQVDELVEIVDSADRELRAEVKAIEEREKVEKKAQIRDLWDKHVTQYQVSVLDPDAFDVWFHYDLTNKTTTFKTIEKDMVDWLEKTESDIISLGTLGDEYVTEYLLTYDTASAISNVNDRKQVRDRIKNDEVIEEVDRIITATFTVYGTKDITLTKMLLDTNNITYTEV